MKRNDKPKYSVWKNLGWYGSLAWRLDKEAVLLPGVAVVLQLLQRLAELFIAPAILQQVENAGSLSRLLLTIGGFTLCLLLFSGASAYVREARRRSESYVSTYLYVLVNEKACTTAYANLLCTPHREKSHQATRAIAWGEQAGYMILPYSAELLTAILGFAVYLLLLSGLRPLLLAVVAVTAVIGFFVNKHVNEWVFRHRDESAKYESQMNYVSNNVMGNEMGKDMRIFGIGAWMQDIYDSAMRLYRGFCNRREKRYLIANLVDVLLSILRNGIAYVYLIWLTLREGLPASEFLLYFTAVSGFTAWVTTILDKTSLLQKCSINLCRFREYLEWPEPFKFEEGKSLAHQVGTVYELRLEDVSYHYPEGDGETISHMDLTIRSGEKLAIVGLNGAGKTTLVKLLCGLLDPTQGRVLLNGQDIRQYNRRDYYKLFAAVFQDFSRLQDSIAVNVAQMNQGMDIERVRKCIDLAGLTQMVDELPNGLDTKLGKQIYDEGIELSGGQQQRLMLARALYKDAPILVLDEPTAALDPIAENDIYMKYNEMSAGRTTVFISHRLASTRFCDRILFLKDGVITEEGTHDELMAQGGGYAALFGVQSRYYQEGGEECGEG